jgi:starvation-inducible DNA-binding protein
MDNTFVEDDSFDNNVNISKEPNMDELVQSLKAVLANEYAFALKAQNFHWNVEGPDFKQYHGLFGDIYEEVYGSVDVIAERVRTLGAYAPGSFSRFSQLTEIEDQVEIPTAKSMIQKLVDDTSIVLDSISRCYELAEAAGNYGLANLLADRQDAHAKHLWMLTSTLKINRA